MNITGSLASGKGTAQYHKPFRLKYRMYHTHRFQYSVSARAGCLL